MRTSIISRFFTSISVFSLHIFAYHIKTVEKLNGHNYFTNIEQPFFRVYHRPHFKVFRPGTPKNAQYFNPPLYPLFFPSNGNIFERQLKRENNLNIDVNENVAPFTSSDMRSIPQFGYHHLPKGESHLGAQWPNNLRPFLKCMDLHCQCPLFNGTAVYSESGERQCRLPSGNLLKKAIRKEYRTLTREERTRFVHYLNEMKTNGMYNVFGLIHRKRGVHSGPGFFPWHREFIKRLEMSYRMLNPEQGLPYWDSTLDNNLPDPADSVMFSDELMGDTDDDGNVVFGPFANWSTIDGRETFYRQFGAEKDGELFNDARIDFILNQSRIDRVLAFSLPLHTCINYDMDDRFLEYSHDYAHYFIAGDMLERFSSSNDPIFFMHHGFVDFIWETWRQKKQSRKQREIEYPRNDGECMPEWHFSYSKMSGLEPMTNRDALSNEYTDNLYEYAPRPSCRRHSSECESEFLFCDYVSNPDQPKCTAKVKSNGKCTNFEWSSDVCYALYEKCINGRCTISVTGENM